MSYNNSVLVGNWSEERLKNEYEFKLFLRKRDRRELLLQRSRTLFSNLLKERPLAISGTFVLYGFNVQLVASDMPVKLNETLVAARDFVHVDIVGNAANTIICRSLDLRPLPRILRIAERAGHQRGSGEIFSTLSKKISGGKTQFGLALSSLVSERQVDYMQNINDGCLMTLSPITTPCCRNTFIILSVKDITLHGVKMNYGDEFFLKAENYGDPEAAPLYVRYTPEAVPGPSDRMPIRLSSTLDSNCRWTTMPLLPGERLEKLGNPIMTGARLIVKNCIADKSLCVMNQNWMQTFFGPECGVTCRDYRDIHQRYTAENIFTLVSDVESKGKD